MQGEIGIFPQKRMSQGAIKQEANAKAGTFAFGAQVQSGRSISVKPNKKQQRNL